MCEEFNTPVLGITEWQVRLGKKGVEEVLGLGNLTDYERKALEAMKEELMSSIKKGVDFVT